MSTFGYAVEQIIAAVYILATEEGNLRERLKKAARERILWVPTDHLPDHLKRNVETLKEELTQSEASSGSDRVTPTLDGLSGTELFSLADRVVAMAFEMAENKEAQRSR